MTIIDNILNRFGLSSTRQFDARIQEAVKSELDKTLPRWLGETADAAKWNMPDPSIFANQADLYRLSPILGTAVDILGGDLGTSKFNVKRMRGDDLIDIPNHPYELLLRNPNPIDSGIEFAQFKTSNYKLNGNAVIWLNRKSQSDTPDEMWPIPFGMVQPVPDERMYIDHWDYSPGAGKPPVRLETWEIVHYKTFNPNNRFIGLSPLESLAMTIQGDLAMRKTNTVNFAEYGGAPQSILAFKDYPVNDVWDDVKAEVRNAAKRNEMMMLRGVGDGITWMQRALSNKDMDFIAGLQRNLVDVFNRMCPGLVSMLSENATEANALAARATYAEKTLWPMMEVFAQKDTSDILSAYGLKLVGIYDDPRVVDRKLKLEEQTVYERTHTLAEVRKEYYQDDPLGDERDDLIPAQITAGAAKTTEPQQQPADQPPAESAPVNTNEDTTTKAELLKWKRYAIRTFGKSAFGKFENAILPAELMQDINKKLYGCKSIGDVADVFEDAIKSDVLTETFGKFHPNINDGAEIIKLAEAINKAAETVAA